MYTYLSWRQEGWAPVGLQNLPEELGKHWILSYLPRPERFCARAARAVLNERLSPLLLPRHAPAPGRPTLLRRVLVRGSVQEWVRGSHPAEGLFFLRKTPVSSHPGLQSLQNPVSGLPIGLHRDGGSGEILGGKSSAVR